MYFVNLHFIVQKKKYSLYEALVIETRSLSGMKRATSHFEGVSLVYFFDFAFITGNSSLKPLIEGLCAQIHLNLR